MLNERAREALGPFLSKFGQLMELDCEGEPRWFFNAANLLSCVDKDGAVFKDPLAAPIRIYVKEAGIECGKPTPL